MKTILLYLFALLCLFASCSETEETPAPERPYLLQRKLSEITSPNGSDMSIDLTYTYNNLEQLVRVSGLTILDSVNRVSNATLKYDQQGKLIHAQNIYGTTYTNTYNNKGQLMRSQKVLESGHTSFNACTYSALGVLQEVKTYRVEDGSEVFVGTRTYFLKDDRSINVTYTLASGEKYSEYLLQTDDQKRAHFTLPHQLVPDYFFSELFGEGLFTAHNIVKSETLYQRSKIGGHDYQSHYTYNAAGYPLTCIKIFKHGSIERITYVYNH